MSKNQRAQQDTERAHIEAFLRHKGITVTVEYGDAPDAVLLVEGRRVGLEHCELTEEDLAANRPSIEYLPEVLKIELKKLGVGDDISVGLGLTAQAPVFRKRSQVDELAARVARIAAGAATALGVGESIEIERAALAHHGLPSVIVLRVARLREPVPEGPDTFVSPGYWGPVESSARAAVRAKERRLPAYKAAKALDQVWLLLVTGASWVQATDSAMTEWLRLATSFDAVFLLDLRTDELQRLDTGDDT